MIEMVIDRVASSTLKFEKVVLLKEKDADRFLPIWIGPTEASAIYIKLQGLTSHRPSTADLICNILSALGVTTSSIIISDLKDDTFYSKIILDIQGRLIEIDARPSDALGIAVRTKAPIFVTEAVINNAGISPKEKSVQPSSPVNTPESTEPEKEVSEQEIEKLSAFADFINNLNLDDFEKHSS